MNIISYAIFCLAFVLPLDKTPRSEECGLYCLAVALGVCDSPFELSQLADELGDPKEGGYSLDQLSQAASEYGLHTRLVRTSVDNLLKREKSERFACICWLKEGHFVLISDVNEAGAIVVLDPPKSYTEERVTFESRWSGEALLVSTDELSQEESLGNNRFWYVAILAMVVVVGAAVVGVINKRR